MAPAARKKRTRKAPGSNPSPKKSSAEAQAPGGVASAGSLKVRMYRVGFGDFFLVTVPTDAGDRYILIDCGAFKGKSGKGDLLSINDAVEDLYNTTKGELALVIMTHRHADHISGFSRAADRFKNFKVSMVWMPYWEQFNDAKDSAGNLQSSIEHLALQLSMQFRGRNDSEAQVAMDQLWNATGIDVSQPANPGQSGKGGNAAALDLLKNHFGNDGKNVRYYAKGNNAELPPELKGLTAEILGPPPQSAKAFMRLTDLKKGIGQYLDSTKPGDTGAKAFQPFGAAWHADQRQDYPARDRSEHAVDYEGVKNMVDTAQPDMLAAAADKIDTFLNNQSLVVLFKFAGKSLLFVGDAQAGNWEDWIYKTDTPVKDPATPALEITGDSLQILQTIDFYKVGHHGSTNATPIAVVQALGRNHSGSGLVAMCSTQEGVYGDPDKGTEVPRDPLMQALGSECTLIRSDSLAIKAGGQVFDAESDLPTPKAGKVVKGALYIEYILT